MFTNLSKNNLFILLRKNYPCNIQNVRFYSKINKNNYATEPAPRNPSDPYNEAEWKYIFDEVKGITNVAFRQIGSDEILGPGSGPDCCHKVPEYFAYHRYSYYEFISQIASMKANVKSNPPKENENVNIESSKDDTSIQGTELKLKEDCDKFELLEDEISDHFWQKKFLLSFPIFDYFDSTFSMNNEPIILIRQDDNTDSDKKKHTEDSKKQEVSNLKRAIKALERIFNKIFSRKGSNDELPQSKGQR